MSDYTHQTIDERTTYEVSVTPSFAGLAPQYNPLVYRWVRGGICGPFVETDEQLPTLAAVDAWLAQWGYERSADYGSVCANGFASAPLKRLPTLYGSPIIPATVGPQVAHEPAFVGGK